MQHFDSDYMEGMHPQILEAITRTNMQKTSGYGTDEYCASAREKILAACGLRAITVGNIIGSSGCSSILV